MTEETLVLLKNDCVSRGLYPKVMQMILDKGVTITRMGMFSPIKDIIEEHYAEHKGKSFFDGLCERMADKPLIAMIVSGKDSIKNIRAITGKTDCSEPGTIRGLFGTGVEGNIIHSSANAEDAKREVEYWKRFIGS